MAGTVQNGPDVGHELADDFPLRVGWSRQTLRLCARLAEQLYRVPQYRRVDPLGLDFGSVRQPEVSRQLGERQIVNNASNEFAVMGAKQQLVDQDTALRVESTGHAHEDSPCVANGSFDLFVPVLARAQSENSVPLYECLVEIEM